MLGSIYWKLGIALGFVVLLALAYGRGYHSGKESVYAWLEKEQAKVIKDGKEIDAAVEAKTDDEKCDSWAYGSEWSTC